MKIFPAIDLFGGQAVRLYKGDYDQMTVYDPEPLNTVRKFEAAGAKNLHLVDLEGAKTGQTTNLPTIEKLAANTGLFIEVGGGIRNMDTVRRYLEAGASRVILGTAAVTDPDFLAAAVAAFRAKEINRIILTRPAVEAGERLGFLPGDLQSKVDPYLRPLYDALFDMLGAETYQK